MLEYLYGELSPRKRRSVEKHLRTCADCPKEIDSYKATVETFSKLRMEEPTADLTERISAIAQRDVERHELLYMKRTRSYWKPALAAAAVSLVVVLSIVYYLPQAAKNKVDPQKLAAVKQGEEMSRFEGSGNALAKKEVAKADEEPRLRAKGAEVSEQMFRMAGKQGSKEIAVKERPQSETKDSAPIVAESSPASPPAEDTLVRRESERGAPEALGMAAHDQEAAPPPSAPVGATAEPPKAVLAFQQPMKVKSADIATDKLEERKPTASTAQEEFLKANADFFNRDFSSAAAAYQKVIDLEPKGDRAVDARYRQGQSYQQLQVYEKALAAYEEIIRDHPDFYALGDVYLAAGDCYLALNREEDALRSFEIVRDQFPIMRDVAVQRIDRMLSQRGANEKSKELTPEGK